MGDYCCEVSLSGTRLYGQLFQRTRQELSTQMGRQQHPAPAPPHPTLPRPLLRRRGARWGFIASIGKALVSSNPVLECQLNDSGGRRLDETYSFPA